MTQAIAYLRVSTEDQVESGLGLSAQADAIQTHSKRLGIEVVGWYRDEGIGGSVGIERRPGLLGAIDALKADDVLMVAKRDRLSRDVMLACWIDKEVKRRRARVISVAGEGTDGDDPTSMLMRRIVDAFSEYERGVIRARTRGALMVKRAKGERTGEVPFGYTLDGDGVRLVPDDGEQSVLALIGQMRSSGASLRTIARELTARSVPTKKGGRWQAQTVKQMCVRMGA